MRGISHLILVGVVLSGFITCVRADIIVGTDGKYTDGKITSYTDKEIVIQVDGADAQQPRHIDRATITRVIFTDDHGARIDPPAAIVPTALWPATQPAHWDVPVEPAAPLMRAAPSPSYYLIPLRGEVGATILAGAVEKSLADAVARHATVVVLDIQSPGGSVDEALRIMKVIAHFNRQIPIVVLAEQDLSAAAILSLSVKKIYLKPFGTIGAATAFVPGKPDLSAKVEEKMQSAWRAAARSSAQEGGHEPLLADAMIDNTIELHLEIVGGKAVIKEGPGDKCLCRKGRILTLTCQEACECGLAAGRVEDLAELGKTLGYPNWTECPGLGTALAAYLPKWHDAFEVQIKKIAADFAANMEQAKQSDPSQERVYITQGITPGTQILHGPQIHRPMVGPRLRTSNTPNQEVVRVRKTSPREWKAKSLLCVTLLQQAEANLRDAVSLCNAFGNESAAALVTDALTQIGAIRAKIYDERNRYGQDSQVAVAAPVVPAVAPTDPAQPVAPAPDHPRPHRFQPGRETPNGPQPTATPAELAEKLKKIEAAWQPAKGTPIDLTRKLTGTGIKEDADGGVLIPWRTMIRSSEPFHAPMSFRIILLNDQRDIRVGFGANQIIFNWEMRHDELRVDGGPVNGHHRPGAGLLPKGTWVGLELTVTAEQMIIFVDGAERYREKADFHNVFQFLTIRAHNGDLKIKSVTAVQP